MRSFLTMNLLGTLPAMGALGNDSLRNWRDNNGGTFTLTCACIDGRHPCDLAAVGYG